jgi:hypothetical protein
MAKKTGATLGLVALGIYILGGLASFSGLGLIFFMKGTDLYGLGDGRTIGYLLLCSGVCFSMIGVLLMRLFRNRGIA